MFARVAIIASVCDFIGMLLLVLHRGTFIVARTMRYSCTTMSFKA